jgi:hypothetical protein
MDRKAANSVMRQYKEFADYLAGFISLRTEVQAHRMRVWGTPSAAHHMEDRYSNVVRISLREVVDVLGMDMGPGMTEEKVRRDFAAGFRQTATPKLSLNKIAEATGWERGFVEIRRAQHELFLSMIDSDQPEDIKHDNFYKAALAVALGNRTIHIPMIAAYDRAMLADEGYTVSPSAVPKHFREALMMAHAEKVLKVTMLEGDKMPNRAYVGWITGDVK